VSEFFLYKLGHSKDLAIAELKSIIPSDFEIKIQGDFVFVDYDLDIQKLGSVVFKAKLLKYNIGEKLNLPKQNGLVCPKFLASPKIRELKLLGARKINVLSEIQKFNFGHWKQTKSWFWFYNDQFWQIQDCFDQELWSELDQNLPFGEMARGLINLKLARSLLNLTSNQNIWDPLAGVGRVCVAGYDIKTDWKLSDKDDLKTEIRGNLNYIKKFENNKIQTCSINQFDATLSFDRDLDLRKHDYSIVTEGWLGKNFVKLPTLLEIQREWVKVFGVWKKILKNSAEIKIPEIIFCLPFYKNNNQTILPDLEIQNLLKNSKYQIQKLNNKNYILYSRPKSITGHLIMHLSLVS
jgi:hypothetical protein